MKYNKRSMYGLLLLIIISSFFLYQIKSVQEEDIMFNEESSWEESRINLHFGKEGNADFLKYTYGNKERQPAGMDFMRLIWRAPQLGKVKIITEQSDLDIDNVLMAYGVEIGRYSNDGIQIISVDSSLNYDEYVTNDEAYTAYVALVQEYLDKGWKQYFLPFDARIDQRDNIKHIQEKRRAISPSHILTKEEWDILLAESLMGVMYIHLYNDEILLNLSLERKTSALAEKVQYHVSYRFRTIKYTTLNLIPDSAEMNLEELKAAFNAKLERNVKNRQEIEADRIKEGYRIDEDYQYNYEDDWKYISE